MGMLLLAVGQLCFGVIGIAVGVKMVRAAAAEGGFGLPALVSAAIFVGGSGLAMIQLGTALGEGASGSLTALVGEYAMRAGVVFFAAFVWRVFGPHSWLGGVGVALCMAALFGSLVWDLRSQTGWWPYDYSLPSAVANQVAIALPFSWSLAASLRSWRRMGRQIAIGLGDPVVRNRFALWAVASAAFIGLCVLAAAAGQATQHDAIGLASAMQGCRGLLYFVVTGAICLGIFTPKAFRAQLSSTA